MTQKKRATVLAHEHVREAVSLGDTVVDATVGNGHDTLFLAGLVGEEGNVIGFDVLEEALNSAKARLAEASVLERVSLHHVSHAELAQYCQTDASAVMFNLGYLPGGDQEAITLEGSTIAALEAALGVLGPGGVVTCVCYPGHPGGLEEAEAVLAWSQGLSPSYRAGCQNEKGRHEGRPFLVSVWRRD